VPGEYLPTTFQNSIVRSRPLNFDLTNRNDIEFACSHVAATRRPVSTRLAIRLSLPRQSPFHTVTAGASECSRVSNKGHLTYIPASTAGPHTAPSPQGRLLTFEARTF